MATNHSQGQKIRYIRAREIENAASVGEAIGTARRALANSQEAQMRIDALEAKVERLEISMAALSSALIDMLASANRVD